LDVDWDGDFWADHDEDCHGTIDSEELREEYPDGYRWSCCNMLGGGGKENDENVEVDEDKIKGCQTGPHRVNETAKRLKRK
jgi:hypothetical protein